MIIIRPITKKDQDFLAEFSFESVLGMTNLPRDRQKQLDKITHSETCFSSNIEKPNQEEYYFVLEDLTTGRLGGTCGILAQSAQSLTHCYRIEKIHNQAKYLSVPKEIRILKVLENPYNYSEICALYLQPSFRHSGLGRLLSLSRFLFIAAFPHRFRNKILAEMRGYIDQRQVSPFWEAIGRHFCDLSFVELMAQIDQIHMHISEILPKFPIYIDLLPQEAQEVIGKIHDSTKPAYEMLTQENFSFNQEIDIFEGGPILTASTNDIRSIHKSSVSKVDITKDTLPDEFDYILGNEKIDFRACFGKLKITSTSHVMINEEVANALQVKKGEKIRYVTIH